MITIQQATFSLAWQPPTSHQLCSLQSVLKQQPFWSHLEPKSNPFTSPIKHSHLFSSHSGAKAKGPAPASAAHCPHFCDSLWHLLSSRNTSLLAVPRTRQTHARPRGTGLVAPSAWLIPSVRPFPPTAYKKATHLPLTPSPAASYIT